MCLGYTLPDPGRTGAFLGLPTILSMAWLCIPDPRMDFPSPSCYPHLCLLTPIQDLLGRRSSMKPSLNPSRGSLSCLGVVERAGNLKSDMDGDTAAAATASQVFDLDPLGIFRVLRSSLLPSHITGLLILSVICTEVFSACSQSWPRYTQAWWCFLLRTLSAKPCALG